MWTRNIQLEIVEDKHLNKLDLLPPLRHYLIQSLRISNITHRSVDSESQVMLEHLGGSVQVHEATTVI